MAEITRKRLGEFVRVIFDMLTDKPDGLPASEIVEHIPNVVKLTEFERSPYISAPGTLRYQKIVRFATIGPVKAGWMVKTKGRWYITDEGRQAYKKFPDPEAFFRESDRLYQEWNKKRVIKNTHETEDEVQEISLTIEEAEEKSWSQIQKYLQNINPYEFQELIADLLRAMDYHISWVAPPGKDRGVDIIAFTDPLGAKFPRIKVQVKHRDQSTDVVGLRAFLSVLGTDDLGIYVSASGFTSEAKEEARTQERRKVTLIDLETFYDLWVEHYDQLTQEARQRFPLKPIYFLAPVE